MRIANAAQVGGETQSTALRLQALSTLKAFIGQHYDWLLRSMDDIKAMLNQGLQLAKEENRALRPHLLRFCDALLTRIFDSLCDKKFLPSPTLDYEWWFDLIGLILEIGAVRILLIRAFEQYGHDNFLGITSHDNRIEVVRILLKF